MVLSIIPYGVQIFLTSIQAPVVISLPESYLYIALPLSVGVASVVAYLFQRVAVKNAEEFLLKAEVED